MGIQASGQIVSALREAVTATKGLMIESRAALFAKSQNQHLDANDEGKVVNIYDELEFFGTVREDGTKSDINAVWFSHWYLENLNALYSGPLDYTLWRALNGKSLIASRLYEFLFLKFYGAQDLLRFNYPTLVKFIPVRTERYVSQAKKQLQPAFDLLIESGILAGVQWVESKGGLPQILLRRGPLLSSFGRTSETNDVGEEDFTLDRIEAIQLPEWQVVSTFHQAWGNTDFRPAKAELDLARDMIAQHGLQAVQVFLPRLVKRLKAKWSDAKTFCAISRYLPEVIQELETEKRRARRQSEESRAQEESRRHAIQQLQDRAVLMTLWKGLPADEQEEIRKTILAKQPKNIEKFPAIIERFCLEELGRRNAIGQ